VRGILDRRLIFVTGKGGVGKSTVATALGLLAARRGLRTIVAELASREHVQNAFGGEGARFEEVELAPGLFTISIDPQNAMEEYLQLKTGALGYVLASSKLFSAFAMATPGMRELLSIGKIWELAQLERRSRGGSAYDLVIVDAPATGHGLGILRTPRTFAEIARVGPIAHQGRTIAATLADRSFTALLAVATAEEMPVNETLAMREAILAEGWTLDAVVVNSLYPERFDTADMELLGATFDDAAPAPVLAAVRAAISEHARVAMQRAQSARLREGLGTDVLELPYLFVDGIGRPELERLADVLERALSAPAAPAGPVGLGAERSP
jgi:anion-transporting  ArsA/GET3 family ATPase